MGFVLENLFEVIKFLHLTPMLAAWPLRGHMGLKSFWWETLFLDQLHDFSLSSFSSFLHLFLKSKFMQKIPWHQKNFIFEVRLTWTQIDFRQLMQYLTPPAWELRTIWNPFLQPWISWEWTWENNTLMVILKNRIVHFWKINQFGKNTLFSSCRNFLIHSSN